VPEERWPDKASYKLKYKQLGGLFVENFRKFADECPPEVVASGPNLNAY
jgi:phosphoenolpyruvate carboxykinase (ATP)